jgi:hypothetical protein
VAPVKGSGPPATVVVTPPIELVGADETVPPTELEVVSRVVVVTSDVVVGLTVVVVAPLVVVGLTVVVVAPLVVVGLTVVVVAPLVVVVGLTVVVVAPLVVVVGLTVVVVAPPVVVVGLTVVVVAPVVVVDLSVVVVVPPEEVADASCPTLTPPSTIMATAISQAAVRLRVLFACLAIDSYLLLSASPSGHARDTGRTRQPLSRPSGAGGRTAQSSGVRDLAVAAADRSVRSCRAFWCAVTSKEEPGGLEEAAAAGWPGRPPQETAGSAGRHDIGRSRLVSRVGDRL